MNFLQKAAALLKKAWTYTPPGKQPFFSTTSPLPAYLPSPDSERYVHNPSFIASDLAGGSQVDFSLEAGEDELATLTPKQRYDRERYQQKREQFLEYGRKYRAAKRAAAAGQLSKEDAEEEAFLILERRRKQREANRRHQARKKAGEKGRATKLNLGVPRRLADGRSNQEYQRAYYSRAKATGNTANTFTGSSTSYGYGSSH